MTQELLLYEHDGKYLKKVDCGSPLPANVAAAFAASVAEGNLVADLQMATEWVKTVIKAKVDSASPLGLAAPLLSAVDIAEKLEQHSAARGAVLFSGALGMLYLTARTGPLECMVLAKMKLAANQLISHQDVNSMVKNVNIYAEQFHETVGENFSLKTFAEWMVMLTLMCSFLPCLGTESTAKCLTLAETS